MIHGLFAWWHRVGCRHKDVDILPPPRMHDHLSEKAIQMLRRVALKMELPPLFVPTPGPKDVSIGLPSRCVNQACDRLLSDLGGRMLACSKCGWGMDTYYNGFLTPPTMS